LVDALHVDYFVNDPNVAAPVKAVLANYNATLGQIGFYDSMVVVSKLAAEKTKPYRRVLSGDQMPVQPVMNWLPEAPLTGLTTMVMGPLAGERVNAGLLALIEHHRECEQRALSAIAKCADRFRALDDEAGGRH